MFLKIIAFQARFRWPVTLLLWLVMTALVSLYVYLANSTRYAERSMQLIMKNLGHNLVILPTAADPLAAHSCSDGQTAFPEETTRAMAAHLPLNSKYYVSVAQGRRLVDAVEIVLTGAEPVSRADESREKRHLFRPIEPGTCRLGADVARALSLGAGDRIEIDGRSFTVAQMLRPEGTLADCRVFTDLATAQELLACPGRIHCIWAFLCMHGGALPAVLARQDATMSAAFPDFRTIPKTRIAQGRDLARRTTSRYLKYLLLLVLGITVLTIAITGLQEVADRRREVGLLLAVGGRYRFILGLYLVKIAAIALLAGVAGFLAGSLLSRGLLADVLVTNTQQVAVRWAELPGVLTMVCAVALLAEVPPMVKLIRMDPVAILLEE